MRVKESVVRFRVFLLLFAILVRADAHDGLDVAPPQSEAEAWNTVQLCAANVQTLIAQQQWSELPMQLGIAIQATRFLRERSATEQAAKWVAFDGAVLRLVRAALQKQNEEVATQWDAALNLKRQIEGATEAKLVHAAVYSCPMCRGIRESKADAECFKCGMKVVPRMIPASSLYNTPGEPSVVLSPELDAPLAAGRASRVLIKFSRKKDGTPVAKEDLLVVHTERIHLLIVDESLGDYHHIYPTPTERRGVYEFTITPQRDGPYRVFADIVPLASNVQEYAVCDLAASEKGAGDGVLREGLPTSSVADGMRFQIQWNTTGRGLPVRQPINGVITVSDQEGRAFTQLEPLMGAYVDLVAFHEDRRTVLHVHPSSGSDPEKPEDRGGPRFSFRFWAPKPGFYRLYVQVRAGGKPVFAPFALSVE